MLPNQRSDRGLCPRKQRLIALNRLQPAMRARKLDLMTFNRGITMSNITDPTDVPAQSPVLVSPVTAPDASIACGPSSLLDDPFVPQVVEVCREIFPGEVSTELVADPSEPCDAWLSFRVAAGGNFPGILKRERIWHQRVFELTGDRQQRYRLFVVPRE
jgi:hypothetical protein